MMQGALLVPHRETRVPPLPLSLFRDAGVKLKNRALGKSALSRIVPSANLVLFDIARALIHPLLLESTFDDSDAIQPALVLQRSARRVWNVKAFQGSSTHRMTVGKFKPRRLRRSRIASRRTMNLAKLVLTDR